MWTISKEFSFEMGHRVWSQQLNHPNLSISTDCACKHLHGHSYTLKVNLSADELDITGMVTDFKNLNFMKEFLDNNLDHKFMIDIHDPNFEFITTCPATLVKYAQQYTNLSEIYKPNSEDQMLHLRSFVLVDFVPTSENICKQLAIYAQSVLGEIATVTATELWETKKSYCRYDHAKR